jgi:hypothetical protein
LSSSQRASQAGRLRASRLWAPVFIAVALATSLAVPASAEYNYSCGYCATINGREETISYNEGTNYSFAQVCVTIWKNNGGGNYSTAGHRCENVYTVGFCSTAGAVYGHGEVYNHESGAHMAGHQDRRCG